MERGLKFLVQPDAATSPGQVTLYVMWPPFCLSLTEPLPGSAFHLARSFLRVPLSFSSAVLTHYIKATPVLNNKAPKAFFRATGINPHLVSRLLMDFSYVRDFYSYLE